MMLPSFIQPTRIGYWEKWFKLFSLLPFCSSGYSLPNFKEIIFCSVIPTQILHVLALLAPKANSHTRQKIINIRFAEMKMLFFTLQMFFICFSYINSMVHNIRLYSPSNHSLPSLNECMVTRSHTFISWERKKEEK